MRADHYRIVGFSGYMFRRRYARLDEARRLAKEHERIAAMNQAGKVLRYLPVNPKAGR